MENRDTSKKEKEKMVSLSVRVSEAELHFMKTVAQHNHRTVADQLRFMIDMARHNWNKGIEDGYC